MIVAASAVGCGAKTGLDAPPFLPDCGHVAPQGPAQLNPAAACRWQAETPTPIADSRAYNLISLSQRTPRGALVSWHAPDAYYTRAIDEHGQPIADAVRVASVPLTTRGLLPSSMDLAATCDGFLAVGTDGERGCMLYRLDRDGRPTGERVLDSMQGCALALVTREGLWVSLFALHERGNGVEIYDDEAALTRRLDLTVGTNPAQSWVLLDDGTVVVADANGETMPGGGSDDSPSTAGIFLTHLDARGVPLGPRQSAIAPGVPVGEVHLLATSEGLLFAWITEIAIGQARGILRVQAFGLDLAPRGIVTRLDDRAVNAWLGVARGIPLVAWNNTDEETHVQPLTSDAQVRGEVVSLPSTSTGSPSALLDVPDGALLVLDHRGTVSTQLLRCEAP